MVQIIPLVVALGALGFGFVRGRRHLRLLVDSRLAAATLDRHDTPGFFQKRHRTYFVYDDHLGRARTVLVKTALPGHLERGPFVVAHDDSDPPHAQLLRALAGAPALGDDQYSRDGGVDVDLLLSLLLPAAGVVASLAVGAVALSQI